MDLDEALCKTHLSDEYTKLRDIFDVSPIAIVIIDLNGKIVDCNEQAQKILGHSSRSEATGRSALESIAENDRQRAMENMEKVLKQGLMRNIEYTIITKDGSERLLSATATVLKDASGNSTGFVSAIEDITERRKMEERLRISEAKYRSLVEQSIQGVLIAQGPIPHIVFANSTMSKILGYSVEELTSLSTQQTTGLVHADDRELFFGRFKDRLEGKPAPPQYEFRGIRKDGTIVWLELSSVRIEYDGQPAVQAVFVDITERKKAEDALRRREEKFRDLFDNVNDGIVYLNGSGRILDLNRRTAEMFGGTKEELIGKQFTEIGIFSIKETPELLGNFARILAGHTTNQNVTIENKRGQRIDLECSASLVKTDKAINIVVVARDITERKQIEEKMAYEREFFNALMDNIPDAIYFKDTKSCFTRVNAASCPGLGIKDPEEAIGMTDFDFAPEELAKQFYADDQMVMKSKEPIISKEEVMIDKIGRKWYSATKVPIKDKNNKVIAL